MAGYTRQFLVEAFTDKYRPVFKTEDEFYDFVIRMGYDHYDKVGKGKFRVDTGLDAQAIKEYKNVKHPSSV